MAQDSERTFGAKTLQSRAGGGTMRQDQHCRGAAAGRAQYPDFGQVWRASAAPARRLTGATAATQGVSASKLAQRPRGLSFVLPHILHNSSGRQNPDRDLQVYKHRFAPQPP